MKKNEEYQPRDITLKARFTNQEYAYILKKKSELNAKTMSVFLRKSLLDQTFIVKTHSQNSEIIAQKLDNLHNQYIRVARNINVFVRKIQAKHAESEVLIWAEKVCSEMKKLTLLSNNIIELSNFYWAKNDEEIEKI